MRTKQVMTQAAWLWLPLFIAVCLLLGFYNSATASGSTTGQYSSCPDASAMSRLLHCP